jgi:ketosteroid isomerase-like protein
MMKLFALILLAGAGFAASTNDPAEKDVLAAMDAFKKATIARDGATLSRLLADDLTYTHSAGQEQTKAQYIDSIVSGKSVVEALEFTGTSVRAYGNIALVKGRVDLSHSKTNVVHMNILHVWRHTPNGWQMIARQATRLSE